MCIRDRLTTNPLMAEGHPPKTSINPSLVNCDTGCIAVLALDLLFCCTAAFHPSLSQNKVDAKTTSTLCWLFLIIRQTLSLWQPFLPKYRPDCCPFLLSLIHIFARPIPTKQPHIIPAFRQRGRRQPFQQRYNILNRNHANSSHACLITRTISRCPSRTARSTALPLCIPSSARISR